MVEEAVGKDDDDNYGYGPYGDREEKIKVVVMIEKAAGTKEVVDDQDEKKKKKIKTETTTNVKSSSSAAAAAGDHPTVVDGEKLKARVKRLIMWSLVYFLLYWIRLVIKRDYYEDAQIYTSIMFTLVFLLLLIFLTREVVGKINSLVLFMTTNHNIPPPSCGFKSSTTTTIHRMRKEIRDSCVNILFISFMLNYMHMVLIIVLPGISLRMSNQSPKSDDFVFQMLYAGCIFYAITMHVDWEDKFHEELAATTTQGQ